MLHQKQTQKQQLKILPQQIQLLNLFHLTRLELEHRIQQELEDNPLLEETAADQDDSVEKFSKETVQDYQDWDEFEYDDIPNYKLEYESYMHTPELPQKPLSEVRDFRSEVKEQYRHLTNDEKEVKVADYLIDSLTENGLLELELDRIADDLSFKLNEWMEVDYLENVLHKIQDLEPLGVGARSIQECLLIQLRKMNGKRPDVKLAVIMLQKYFTDLRNRNMEKIMKELSLEEEELKIVLQLIGSLKMKPVAESLDSLQTNHNILPDFVVTREGEHIEVMLYNQRSNRLHINNEWMAMVQETENNKSVDKATVQYMKSKLNAAQWFVHAIQQRESTMLKVMKTIIGLQRDYFMEGDISLLKPMILKNVADIAGVDISTVSRVTSNKYAETHFGTILLKDLFTEGIVNQEGKLISNKVIQTAIEDAIDKEDKKKPYTDQQLVGILAKNGFKIARRTVAKYRELLQIPVAQMRALWA